MNQEEPQESRSRDGGDDEAAVKSVDQDKQAGEGCHASWSAGVSGTTTQEECVSAGHRGRRQSWYAPDAYGRTRRCTNRARRANARCMGKGGIFPELRFPLSGTQYQVHRPPSVDARPRQAPMDQPHVPSTKESKLALRTFDGSEVYNGLGSGFEQWMLLLIEQVEMAEMAHCYRWAERAKVNKFAEHLRGRVEKYFQQHEQRWWGNTSQFVVYHGADERRIPREHL
ncbi:unnamed protein product [Phytophthora fragariaefolia]|uniref:Unnamed protein product n=1 Tax=Phytophthora fragariaefolia TaxID=1490495 RepID=A0A9W7CUX7_9STRA|nr:unnamed protein product [Phytophthora fragariaefolia]